MTENLNIKLYGPCRHDYEMPEVGDTIAVFSDKARVQFKTVVKVEPSIRGIDIWVSGGIRYRPEDCYLVYSEEQVIFD